MVILSLRAIKEPITSKTLQSFCASGSSCSALQM